MKYLKKIFWYLLVHYWYEIWQRGNSNKSAIYSVINFKFDLHSHSYVTVLKEKHLFFWNSRIPLLIKAIPCYDYYVMTTIKYFRVLLNNIVKVFLCHQKIVESDSFVPISSLDYYSFHFWSSGSDFLWCINRFCIEFFMNMRWAVALPTFLS